MACLLCILIYSGSPGTGPSQKAGRPDNQLPGTVVQRIRALFGTGYELGTGNCVVYRGDVNEVDVTGMSANTTRATTTVPMNGNLRAALSRI